MFFLLLTISVSLLQCVKLTIRLISGQHLPNPSDRQVDKTIFKGTVQSSNRQVDKIIFEGTVQFSNRQADKTIFKETVQSSNRQVDKTIFKELFSLVTEGRQDNI